MGVIISAAFAWLASAIVACVGWVGAAVTSSTLVQFWQFAAKIAFVYLLNVAFIMCLSPFVVALTNIASYLGQFGQFTLWASAQLDLTYWFTIMFQALICAYGYKLIKLVF